MPHLVLLLSQSANSSLRKARDKPPPGYEPIQGSRHGGWHHLTAKGWRRWYPDGGGVRAHLHPEDAHLEPGALPTPLPEPPTAAPAPVVPAAPAAVPGALPAPPLASLVAPGLVSPGMGLSVAEQAIRDQPQEHAVIFGGAGQQIGYVPPGPATKDYDPNQAVTIPAAMEPNILGDPGCVVTHNHPRNNGLSPQDVRVAVSLNLAEMRVVTREGVWALKRPGATWPDPVSVNWDALREGLQISPEDLKAKLSAYGVWNPALDRVLTGTIQMPPDLALPIHFAAASAASTEAGIEAAIRKVHRGDKQKAKALLQSAAQQSKYPLDQLSQLRGWDDDRYQTEATRYNLDVFSAYIRRGYIAPGSGFTPLP